LQRGQMTRNDDAIKGDENAYENAGGGRREGAGEGNGR
jgi:hypothetical protein